MQEKKVTLKSGKEVHIKVEAGKITVGIPNPNNLKLEEIEAKPDTICSGCTGILEAVKSFV